MKDYFENITQITQAGYGAILRVKRRRQRLVYRCIGVVLATPFVGRLGYLLVLLVGGAGDHVQLHVADLLFVLLLLMAIWVWRYPEQMIRTYIRQNRSKLHLGTVHQYSFYPDHLQMMTSASSEKHHLSYRDLTWVYPDGQWIVMYFASRRLTLLVDRGGFSVGSADACLAFLRRQLAS